MLLINETIFKYKQCADISLSLIIRYLEYEQLPVEKNDWKGVQCFICTRTYYILVYLLYLLYYTGAPTAEQASPLLVILTGLREEILNACHDNIFIGHLGFAKIYACVRQKYYTGKECIPAFENITFNVPIAPHARTQ